MSVTQVTEDFEGASGSLDTKFNRSYVRSFHVWTDSPLDGPATVIFARDPNTGLAIPALWASYVGQVATEADLLAVVRRIDPQRDATHPGHWLVRVSYSSEVDPQQLQNANPLNRPRRVSFSTRQYSESIQKDLRTNEAIVNPAGDAYDPVLTRSVTLLVMTITKWLPSFDPVRFARYVGTLNNDTWQGLRLNSVKLADLSAEDSTENGIYAWETKWQFEIRRQADPGDANDFGEVWTPSILNQGYYYLATASDKSTRKRALDSIDATPTTRPVLLNTNGTKWTAGQTPSFTSWNTFEETNFNDLDFLLS